jgi:hypothetical protein
MMDSPFRKADNSAVLQPAQFRPSAPSYCFASKNIWRQSRIALADPPGAWHARLAWIAFCIYGCRGQRGEPCSLHYMALHGLARKRMTFIDGAAS